MAAMMKVKCQCCPNEFMARAVDIRRGWGKFCSKSCKAKDQTKRTGISGADIAAKGMTVNQMQSGKFNRSKGQKSGAYKKHDGRSPMTHKFCHCGKNAVNGLHTITGIEWLCEDHIHENDNCFSSESLGQWI